MQFICQSKLVDVGFHNMQCKKDSEKLVITDNEPLYHSMVMSNFSKEELLTQLAGLNKLLKEDNFPPEENFVELGIPLNRERMRVWNKIEKVKNVIIDIENSKGRRCIMNGISSFMTTLPKDRLPIFYKVAQVFEEAVSSLIRGESKEKKAM